jgi:N-acetylmuramic acid 6-phosphate etherase
MSPDHQRGEKITLKDLAKLTTEQINPRTLNIDLMDSESIVTIMNEEDQTVALAVKKEIPNIARAVDLIVQQLGNQGRLIYIGAGTSGRLGVLDASECPPTFGTSPDLVTFLMAGGNEAFLQAVEGAEDDAVAGKYDLKNMHLSKQDVVVAISASGRTPYCIGGLKYAREIGTPTISLSCNQEAEMSKYADVAIEVVVGPEVLVGSTRLKAGTAQKMVLNMLSTASMIRMGKAYQNLMVDMQPTNFKLQIRAKRMVVLATGITEGEAEKALIEAEWHVKTAIVMIMTGTSASTAKQLLEEANGFTRRAIEIYRSRNS